MKPNYKTSEFWFTAVTFVFSGLFLLGILTDYDQKEELIGDISHGVESLFLIGGQVAVLYKYIGSRQQQKVEYEKRKGKEVENIAKEIENAASINEDIININTGNIVDLIRLPGIGPATAKKIIEYRETQGGFVHTKEIMKIRGVGENIYKEIQRYICI